MRRMLRAEVWGRWSWIKILLHYFWLCGLIKSLNLSEPQHAYCAMEDDANLKGVSEQLDRR